MNSRPQWLEFKWLNQWEVSRSAGRSRRVDGISTCPWRSLHFFRLVGYEDISVKIHFPLFYVVFPSFSLSLFPLLFIRHVVLHRLFLLLLLCSKLSLNELQIMLKCSQRHFLLFQTIALPGKLLSTHAHTDAHSSVWQSLRSPWHLRCCAVIILRWIISRSFPSVGRSQGAGEGQSARHRLTHIIMRCQTAGPQSFFKSVCEPGTSMVNCDDVWQRWAGRRMCSSATSNHATFPRIYKSLHSCNMGIGVLYSCTWIRNTDL